MDLQTARRIARFSQESLAERAQVPVDLVAKLEKGLKPRVSYEHIVRIARALNLSAEELFPVEDAPELSMVGPSVRKRGRPPKRAGGSSNGQ